MEDKFDVLPEGTQERYGVQIDFLIVSCARCAREGRDSHWGVSLKRRGNQVLTATDLTCMECAHQHGSEK